MVLLLKYAYKIIDHVRLTPVSLYYELWRYIDIEVSDHWQYSELDNLKDVLFVFIPQKWGKLFLA